MKKEEKTKLNKGFSLVETLVAIFILSLAISAAMSVAQGSLRASFYARDRIQATFLAQEGLEIVKNIRDKNGLSDRNWLTSFEGSGCFTGEYGCGTDPRNAIVQCINFDCELCLDEGTKILYSKSGFTVPCENIGYQKTGIFRKIEMEEINPNEVEVTVTVTWGNESRELQVKEHIFNWHPFSDLE